LKFQRKKSPEIALEVTPLVDVIFLLLIFFVLSTNFIDVKTMNINLPGIQNLSSEGSSERSLNIEISKDGKVSIDGKEIENFSLNSFINELSFVSADITKAEISADSDTKYQYLVTIMEALNKKGFKNIQMNGVSSPK
jgi:biopolymer transport protein ExbD